MSVFQRKRSDPPDGHGIRPELNDWFSAQRSSISRDFLSNISHELRTPLNLLLGSSGLLRSAGRIPWKPAGSMPS
ncbi:MAG: cell wall metabolism sensor histidine kinase WalK [Chromatiaceae bacterium]|nr:cell wall metabolism sensor histidine kinase WalK [Chromatiaceae bacterium]